MAVQIYLLHLHDAHQGEDGRAAVADHVNQVGGFVLMATSAGSVVAAFDEQWVPALKRHQAVASCGAVTINPHGAAADRLRAMFAANVAAQLRDRGPATTARPATAAGPAGYRPLQWHLPSAAANRPTHNRGGIS